MPELRETLTTDRLTIRPYRVSDAAFLQELFLDEEGGRYLSDPPREKAGPGYLALFETLADDPDCIHFVAVLTATGQPVGTISCYVEGNTVDLGYSIVKDHWRQGLAREMTEAVLAHCARLGFRRATGEVATANDASNRLLRSLGFEPARETTFTKSGTDIVYPAHVYEKALTDPTVQ